MELLGAAGVIAGCLCYTAGSVLARPLMRSLPPAQVAATTNLLGGLILLVLSLLFEPGARAALGGHWGTAAWLAWWYLLIPGSLGATTIYFLLVRDWGASRTGTYAFVSPVVAVLLGVAGCVPAEPPVHGVPVAEPPLRQVPPGLAGAGHVEDGLDEVAVAQLRRRPGPRLDLREGGGEAVPDRVGEHQARFVHRG